MNAPVPVPAWASPSVWFQNLTYQHFKLNFPYLFAVIVCACARFHSWCALSVKEKHKVRVRKAETSIASRISIVYVYYLLCAVSTLTLPPVVICSLRFIRITFYPRKANSLCEWVIGSIWISFISIIWNWYSTTEITRTYGVCTNVRALWQWRRQFLSVLAHTLTFHHSSIEN